MDRLCVDTCSSPSYLDRHVSTRRMMIWRPRGLKESNFCCLFLFLFLVNHFIVLPLKVNCNGPCPTVIKLHSMKEINLLGVLIWMPELASYSFCYFINSLVNTVRVQY